ncbi:hypothetical protein ASPZODRAFT_165779, partial [Penicilliopsis zonata CBS 506.65]
MQTTNRYTPVLLGPPKLPPSLLRIVASGKCKGIVMRGRMKMPCACEKGIFTISSGSNEKNRCTYCDHTIGEHEDVDTLPEGSPSASDLEEKQQDVQKTKASKITNSPLTCPRQDTVSAFADLIESKPVVYVRGTPASGKTTLAHLLTDHLIKKDWTVFFLKTWGRDLDGFCIGNETAWDGLERKLQHYYPHHNLADFFAPKTLLLIDEAQKSYSDEIFWNQIIKERLDHLVPRDIRICLFCSYGSPFTGVETHDYTPAIFHPGQCVTFTPQPIEGSPRIGLFFTRSEFDDNVFRRIQYLYTEEFTLHKEASDYLFSLTNGHPGAVDGMLSYIYEVYRSKIKHEGLSVITKQHVVFSLENEEKVWMYLKGCPVARSFARRPKLTPDAANVLADILEQGSISWDDRPGMMACFVNGWIHKLIVNETPNSLEEEIAVLPSRLHEKWVERYISHRRKPLPERYGTLRELCLDILNQFSVISLQHSSQGKKISSAAKYRPVEAHYQDEFYKAFRMVAGRGVPISSEWSRTKKGSLDFWMPEKMWAIELLRDYDRVDEHISRFQNMGQYHDWVIEGMIKDWIIINCATTVPAIDYPEPNLIHAIFQEDY